MKTGDVRWLHTGAALAVAVMSIVVAGCLYKPTIYIGGGKERGGAEAATQPQSRGETSNTLWDVIFRGNK